MLLCMCVYNRTEQQLDAVTLANRQQQQVSTFVYYEIIACYITETLGARPLRNSSIECLLHIDYWNLEILVQTVH
jgi:hypothetical protein